MVKLCPTVTCHIYKQNPANKIVAGQLLSTVLFDRHNCSNVNLVHLSPSVYHPPKHTRVGSIVILSAHGATQMACPKYLGNAMPHFHKFIKGGFYVT